jgi:hypothetical protein
MLIRMLLAGSLVFVATGVAQPPPGSHFRGGMGGARFLGAQPGMLGRVVKNAPFSADIVTDTTQTLQNGNHIHQTSTTHAYRDSEGRTRLEQDLSNLNALAPNSNLPPVVFIKDPVAGVNYALTPSTHAASRLAMRSSGAGGGREYGRGAGANGNTMRSRAALQNNPNVKLETLGTQVIEGVQATGRRITMTIPVGQIGNEQPIQIVTETWYSPDLQTVVLSKRSDPRSGDTVMRYTNISRAEPASTLFEVPSDYKVTDTQRIRRGAPQN